MEVAGIFVSYRRADSLGSANGVYRELRRQLRERDGNGDRDIFFDIDNIPPGKDFRVVVTDTLARCSFVLVVIGPRWLTAQDDTGRRRIDDPSDTHAIEIEAALDSAALVVPVLVEGASMPTAGELPERIADLAFRNAWTVDVRRFDEDIQQLADSLLQAEELENRAKQAEEADRRAREAEQRAREVEQAEQRAQQAEEARRRARQSERAEQTPSVGWRGRALATPPRGVSIIAGLLVGVSLAATLSAMFFGIEYAYRDGSGLIFQRYSGSEFHRGLAVFTSCLAFASLAFYLADRYEARRERIPVRYAARLLLSAAASSGLQLVALLCFVVWFGDVETRHKTACKFGNCLPSIPYTLAVASAALAVLVLTVAHQLRSMWKHG